MIQEEKDLIIECNKSYEMEILASQSQLAEKMRKSGYYYKVADVISYDVYHDCDVVNNPFAYGYFSFHPTGNSGCIISDDCYFFGIRCNHLMWCEGYCEDVDDDDAELPTSILVYGNHKGNFCVNLIIFLKACDEKEK